MNDIEIVAPGSVEQAVEWAVVIASRTLAPPFRDALLALSQQDPPEVIIGTLYNAADRVHAGCHTRLANVDPAVEGAANLEKIKTGKGDCLRLDDLASIVRWSRMLWWGPCSCVEERILGRVHSDLWSVGLTGSDYPWPWVPIVSNGRWCALSLRSRLQRADFLALRKSSSNPIPAKVLDPLRAAMMRVSELTSGSGEGDADKVRIATMKQAARAVEKLVDYLDKIS